MKIVRLTTFLDFGGIESKMANLATHNDSNQWIFCALGKGGSAEDKIGRQKKEAVSLNLPHKIPAVKTVIKLVRYFKKEKPDVVHCAGGEANFHGVIAAKLAKVPLVVAEEIGIPEHSWLAKRVFSFVYELSDFAVGESQVVIDHLKNTYGLNPRKLRLIPNFCLFPDTDATTSARGKKAFEIVSVSRLEPVKNIEGILRAVYRLKNEGIKTRYTIVGEGSSRAMLEALAVRLNLQDTVVFTGFREDTKPYYLQADLFVLNSFSEGFSNSLLEAMYLKRLCVSTTVGAASEIIENGTNGWIIPVADEQALYRAIKESMGLSTVQKAVIGNNAHHAVVGKYSLQQHAEYLMYLYSERK